MNKGFSNIFYSSFPSFIIFTFIFLLFTQTNWILVNHYYYDLSLRFGGVFAITLPVAWIFFIINAILLLPFRKRIDRYFEWICGLWSPFVVFIFHLPFFYGRLKGVLSQRLIILFFSISFILWIVLQIIFRREILNQKVVEKRSFIKELFSFLIKGTIQFFKKIFLPKWITEKRTYLIFQPLQYPVFIILFFIILFRGYRLCDGFWDIFLVVASSFLGTVLAINSIQTIAGKSRFLSVLNTIFYAIIIIFSLYHLNESVPFDVNLVWENRDIALSPDSFVVYAARAQVPVVAGFFIFMAWIIFLQIRYKIFSLYTQKKRTILFPLLWIIFLIVFFYYTYSNNR